jgi:capsular polysaccharide export protein
LLLQGPNGPFFRRLASSLREHGATVRKVNFNAGDWLFFPDADLNYKGSLDDWPATLQRLLEEWRIDVVFLYGDCRPMHEAAIAVLQKNGIPFYTFEEGYIRGDFVTFEPGRTNGYSFLNSMGGLLLNDTDDADLPEVREVGYAFRHLAVWTVLYHAALFFGGQLLPLFPPAAYHRKIYGIKELWPHIRFAWRKPLYKFLEAGLEEKLCTEWSGRFFLVPLQVPFDSQIECHSDYTPAHGGMNAFIADVIKSFAANAPADTLLVIKQHPLDRGYHDYTRLIRSLSRRHGVEGRVWYIHDLHLPKLLNHARGTVVINSTVGISALLHHCPLKAMGAAFYDIDGLTAQISLDDFWSRAEEFRPNPRKVENFRRNLIRYCQINGNFYKKLPDVRIKCGLNWPQ